MEAEGNTSVSYRCPCNDGVSIAVGYRRGSYPRNTMYHTGMYEIWVKVWGMRGRNKYTSKESMDGLTFIDQNQTEIISG